MGGWRRGLHSGGIKICHLILSPFIVSENSVIAASPWFPGSKKETPVYVSSSVIHSLSSPRSVAEPQTHQSGPEQPLNPDQDLSIAHLHKVV